MYARKPLQLFDSHPESHAEERGRCLWFRSNIGTSPLLAHGEPAGEEKLHMIREATQVFVQPSIGPDILLNTRIRASQAQQVSVSADLLLPVDGRDSWSCVWSWDMRQQLRGVEDRDTSLMSKKGILMPLTT